MISRRCASVRFAAFLLATVMFGASPQAHADVFRPAYLEFKQRAALADMMVNPHAGKALKDELAGLWSFRVGKLRIVYRISDRVARKRCVELVACGPRERIYEETYRLLARGH